MEEGFDRFEWDEAKRLSNIEKHGIDFVRAAEVLRIPFFAMPSPRQGEDRWVAIGELDGQVICIAYTPRGKVCRIISARPTSQGERHEYRTQAD